MRLIDADAYPCAKCGSAYCITNCDKYWAWFHATVDAAPKWVSVEDRLPSIGIDVLVIDEYGGIYTGQYCDNGTWDLLLAYWGDGFTDVTHWMPLPDAPNMDVERGATDGL